MTSSSVSKDRNDLIRKGLLPLSSSTSQIGTNIASPVVWSPDSSMVLSLKGINNVRVLDVKSGEVVKEVTIPRFTQAAWSSDNTYIAFASADNDVWLLAVGSWRLQKMSGHMDWVNSVTWSPDSHTLASCSHDGTLRLWDMCGEGEPETMQVIQCDVGCVIYVAWSPDGAIIASASSNGTVQLWDAKDGSLVQSFGDGEDLVRCLVWSPDGSTIVSVSIITIRIFKVSSGSMLRQLKGQYDWVYSVAWSPDGSTLVSGSSDGRIRFWDGETGDMLCTIHLVESPVYSVSWSPDGKTIASNCPDAAIILWHM